MAGGVASMIALDDEDGRAQVYLRFSRPATGHRRSERETPGDQMALIRAISVSRSARPAHAPYQDGDAVVAFPTLSAVPAVTGPSAPFAQVEVKRQPTQVPLPCDTTPAP